MFLVIIHWLRPYFFILVISRPLPPTGLKYEVLVTHSNPMNQFYGFKKKGLVIRFFFTKSDLSTWKIILIHKMISLNGWQFLKIHPQLNTHIKTKLEGLFLSKLPFFCPEESWMWASLAADCSVKLLKQSKTAKTFRCPLSSAIVWLPRGGSPAVLLLEQINRIEFNFS